MKISKSLAVELVRRHGWDATQQTAILNGDWVAGGSSFFETLGERDEYVLGEVLSWLGY